MTEVTEILRYPIKSHGREDLQRVTLEAATAMPWYRIWAVAHAASKAEPGHWAACVTFCRVAKAPSLMAVTARLDQKTETLTLSHPEPPDISFRPDTEAHKLIDWVMPLVPRNSALPKDIARLDGRGFTDSPFPSATLCSRATHRAVEDKSGQRLSIHRWRGNIWFDGETPWAERDRIGKDILIGGCLLRPRGQTKRCLATTADPVTGRRDVDVLSILDSWGHRDFGVRAGVIEGGDLAIRDKVQLQ